MSDRETPSRSIGTIFKIIFGGLLVLFGGGCVVVWLFYAPILGSDWLWFLAPGLVALALGVPLLRLSLQQSRSDTRKIIFGGLLTLFGVGCVASGLFLAALLIADAVLEGVDPELYYLFLASLVVGVIGLVSLARGVPLLREGLRQRRNDAGKTE